MLESGEAKSLRHRIAALEGVDNSYVSRKRAESSEKPVRRQGRSPQANVDKPRQAWGPTGLFVCKESVFAEGEWWRTVDSLESGFPNR